MEEKRVCLICEKEYKLGDYIVISQQKCLCLKCARQVNSVSTAVMKQRAETKAKEKKEVQAENRAKYTTDGKPTPKKIKRKLDEYVVGQEKAKKILSVAAYNHYKRTEMKDSTLQKSNILLMGPTGCGKTHLVRTMSKILDVPLAIVPATNLTEAGYVGNDVESVVQALYNIADGDKEKTEHGIIFIDEIDKLAGISNNPNSRSVGGKGVQQALLPIIEGTVVEVTEKNDDSIYVGSKKTVSIDTTNILFICGGAFPDMDNIVSKRTGLNSNIGFMSCSKDKSDIDEENLLELVTTDDIKEFGLIPEFIGRLPVRATLKSLDIETLKKILVEPKDSIVTQYKKMFEFDEIKLEFEDDALGLVAQKAKELGTGARSLRSIIEENLLELMYEMPDCDDIGEVRITKDYIEGSTGPVIERRA